MEAENQKPPDEVDVAEEATENIAKTEVEDVTEDQQQGTSTNRSENGEVKTPAKRNYRRRENDDDESSSDLAFDDVELDSTENIAEGDETMEPEEDENQSEDVSLEELRVSGSESENENIATPIR